MVLQETADATVRMNEVFALADDEYRKASESGDDAANALWARAGEKVAKLAALHAISRSPMEPVVDVDAVDWARRFVAHMTRRMLYMAGQFVSDTEYETRAMKLIRTTRQKRGRVSHGKLLRNSHLDKDAFKKVVETLVESGQVKREFGERGGVFSALV